MNGKVFCICVCVVFLLIPTISYSQDSGSSANGDIHRDFLSVGVGDFNHLSVASGIIFGISGIIFLVSAPIAIASSSLLPPGADVTSSDIFVGSISLVGISILGAVVSGIMYLAGIGENAASWHVQLPNKNLARITFDGTGIAMSY